MSDAENLKKLYESIVDGRDAAQILETEPTNPRAIERLVRSHIERPKFRKRVNEDLNTKIRELEERDASSARDSGHDSGADPFSDITTIGTGQRSGQSPEPSSASQNTLKRKMQELDPQGCGQNKKAGAYNANTSIKSEQDSVQSTEPSTASQNTQG